MGIRFQIDAVAVSFFACDSPRDWWRVPAAKDAEMMLEQRRNACLARLGLAEPPPPVEAANPGIRCAVGSKQGKEESGCCGTCRFQRCETTSVYQTVFLADEWNLLLGSRTRGFHGTVLSILRWTVPLQVFNPPFLVSCQAQPCLIEHHFPAS